MTQLMDDRQRTFLRRADALAKLPLNEAFQILTEEMELERLRQERTLTALAMAEEASASDIQRQADYNRGFRDGMRYAVISVPQGAARKLERLDASEPEEEVDDRWA